MDDLTKSRVRKVLALDYWRWTVGIFVLVGLLLWMWAINARHGRFIWMTLLPLLFLWPLFRFYRAARMLTEPTGDVAVQLGTADVSDEKKRRIRLWTKVMVGVTDVLLLFLLLGSVFVGWFRHTGVKANDESRLEDAKYALWTAFHQYHDGVMRDVALFPPPSSAAELPAWAASIQGYLQQPTAVFIREGTDTRWISRPAGLDIMDSLFEVRYTERESKPAKPWAVDTLGSTVIRRFSYGKPRAARYNSGMVFRRLGEDRSWGIVYRHEETWKPFFEHLKAGAEDKDNEPPDWTAELAGKIVQVRRYVINGKEWSSFPVLRASLDGEELYRSPGFDTTGISLVDTMDEARLELYTSRQDNVMQDVLKSDRIPWGRAVIIAIVLGVLHTFWLWIKKLTV